MRNPSSRIPVAISMGDPLGVGPEVILKALSSKEVAGKVIPVVAGLPSVMRKAATMLRDGTSIKPLPGNMTPAAYRTGVVYVSRPHSLSSAKDDSRFLADRWSLPRRGRVAFACVKEAVSLCTSGRADALVTAPLSKASLRAAGFSCAGHTEMLRHLCRCKSTLMMFVQGKHRISLVTTHIPIGMVRRALTMRRVERAIVLTCRGLWLFFGIAEPRLAVLSLNPHKGEDGHLGSEEKTAIEPAIKLACRKGLRVLGPFAADSFFSRGEWENFDAVVAMYHDQGLIPAKLVGGERVTNLTLGLPFVRTSPGHGIAEDIAWKGVADPQGMISAILLAVNLASTVKSPLKWD